MPYGEGYSGKKLERKIQEGAKELSAEYERQRRRAGRISVIKDGTYKKK